MRSVPRNNLPISKVLEYWEQMKSLKVPLDAAAYTSIIAAHSDKNLQHNALEFYKQFIATKQTPTLEMYACVMVLHGKLKNISSLERLYHVATGQTKRLTKNYSMMLLNALITSYSYGGEWQKALTVWNRLRAQFNQDCRAVKRTSAVSPALPDIFMQTSSSMTLQMFGVDTVTICVILDALGKAQRLDEVRSVWDDVRSNNMPLVLNNITSFVEALLRCEQANEALDLVLKLQDKFGIEPDRKLLLNTATLMPVSRYAETVEILKKRYPDVQPVYPPYIRHRQGPKKEALVAAKPGLTAEQLDKQLRFKNGVWLLPPLKFNSQK